MIRVGKQTRRTIFKPIVTFRQEPQLWITVMLELLQIHVAHRRTLKSVHFRTGSERANPQKKKKTHAMSWLSYKTTIRSREYHSRLVWSNIATGQDYSKNMLKWAKATLQPWWWWRVVQFHFHYVCSGWTLRFLTGLNSMKTSEAFRDSLRLSLRRRGVIDVWNGEKTGMRCIPTHTHTHVELQKSCTHT